VSRVPELLLSIVIPVRHDAEPLQRLLDQLPPQPDLQVIVTATGDGDATLAGLERSRADVTWVYGPAGRGTQLNAGAARAEGRWLWFVHADSTLPPAFAQTFHELDQEPGVVGGSFRFALDSASWQARVWEHGVAARVWLFGLAYGDQGQFVRRRVFERMGGFRPLPLMEDVDFIRRLKRQGRIRHLNLQLVTSPRRWEREGWWRRTRGNLTLLALYYVGVSPERLARRYDRSQGGGS
jgi:rSAM/selenodomain-associated transferase 2